MSLPGGFFGFLTAWLLTGGLVSCDLDWDQKNRSNKYKGFAPYSPSGSIE